MKIKLLTSAEGGRTTPAKVGIALNFTMTENKGFELLDRQEIYPGESGQVYFQFALKNHGDRLYCVWKFQLKEGSRTIALRSTRNYRFNRTRCLGSSLKCNN